MTLYNVAYMVVYNDVVEADTPEEAADKVAEECPYDIDGMAWVTNQETGEEYEI